MSELRYLSTDGDYLLLEAADGTQYRLLIDESVRKAARREIVSEGDAAKISPRDIQLEVRSGVTVEDLASKTGASVEYITKFAAPVIDELAHVVSSALSVRITMAGDRYSETTQVEFGEVIANRLAATGVVQYNWSARKTDNGGWQLQCKFGDTLANWAFDPRKLALAPENEVAVQLSTQQSLTDGPLPKLRPVVDQALQNEPPQESARPTFANPVVPLSPAPVAPSQVTPPVSTPAQATPPQRAAEIQETSPHSITEDLGRTAEFEGVVPFGRTSATKESEPAPDLANTADLLDALRKRRLAREENLTQEEDYAEPSEAPILTSVPTSEDYSESAGSIDAEQADTQVLETAPSAESAGANLDAEPESESEVEEEPRSVPKRGRSSMPSWDEIVFSTKTDDE